MSSFLFTGSTGTGKTETTKQLAAILYDDDRNLIRFDMTEYALPESLPRFRRELTNKVSIIPYCIILLDEIEKARESGKRPYQKLLLVISSAVIALAVCGMITLLIRVL
mgnify:CR=1 FL=1